MNIEEFLEALLHKGREYASHHVMLRRQPVESLLNAVAGVISDLPENHQLVEAYRVVYQEMRGEKPPQNWYGPGGVSGG